MFERDFNGLTPSQSDDTSQRKMRKEHVLIRLVVKMFFKRIYNLAPAQQNTHLFAYTCDTQLHVV